MSLSWKLEPGFRVASVVQLGVFEVSDDLQGAGALNAGYAGYIGSIRYIYSRERLLTPYSNPRHWTRRPDALSESSYGRPGRLRHSLYSLDVVGHP